VNGGVHAIDKIDQAPVLRIERRLPDGEILVPQEAAGHT
jgi:hypothetical protein